MTSTSAFSTCPARGSRDRRRRARAASVSSSGSEGADGGVIAARELSAAGPADLPSQTGVDTPAPSYRAHPLLAPHTPLRRIILVIVTFYLGFQTPASAFQRSLALGILAVVLLARKDVMALLSQFAVPPPALAADSAANITVAAAAAGAQEALPSWLRGMSGPQQTAFGVFIYLLAGLCEIGGGWLVWQAVRSGKPWYWALGGSAILVCYGFIATLQPVAAFARVFASASIGLHHATPAAECVCRRIDLLCICPRSLWGLLHRLEHPLGALGRISLLCGARTAMTLASTSADGARGPASQGMALDGFRPDVGDLVGGALVIAGIVVMTAWRRPLS